jgi:hypothetical protein
MALSSHSIWEGHSALSANLEDDKHKKEDSAKIKTAAKMRQRWYAHGKSEGRHQKVDRRATRK